MAKLTALLMIAVVLIAGSARNTNAASALFDPAPAAPTGDCVLDNVFYGENPPVSEDSDVLVFVHGYGGLAQDWWGYNPFLGKVNDMYAHAHAAGYRTAFVNVNVDPAATDCAVPRVPARSVYASGEVLARQIEAIAEHFDVATLQVIAYSKGGMDTEAALVYPETRSRVHRVFTLSTPHQGSIVAGLSCGPLGPVLNVLAGAILQDEGACSLLTADARILSKLTENAGFDIRYHTAAGTGWLGSAGLAEMTGRLLQLLEGDNDGMVTVASTRLGASEPLFIAGFGHYEMALGTLVFPYINAALQGNSRASMTDTIPMADTASRMRKPNSDFILRGGLSSAAVTEYVPIEEEARRATFLLTTSPGANVSLRDPSGRPHTPTPFAQGLGLTTK